MPSSDDARRPDGSSDHADSSGPDASVMAALETGEFVDVRANPYGSNAVFEALLDGPGGHARAIYKPQRGEAPLWDFPGGTLYLREYAAYLVSRSLGWDMVPFTTVRDGPYGIGSVQLWVEHDPQANYFTLRHSHTEAFARVAVFDVLTNNADRKGSHCLLDPAGHVWGIDHGLTFNAVYKLRTVIWDFEGQPIADDLIADLLALKPLLQDGGECARRLENVVDHAEMAALRDRLDVLLEEPVYPFPGLDRNVPWPPT